jgi:hypothetical protein
VRGFDVLIGTWHGEGDLPLEPPARIANTTTVERLGEFVVIRSTGEPREFPDSIWIVGGARDGTPQPAHYFDDRGVKRTFLMTLDGPDWRIWRDPTEDPNGPDGPGFDQRFIGTISGDGSRIDGRWERGTGKPDAAWETDFPITYTRSA